MVWTHLRHSRQSLGLEEDDPLYVQLLALLGYDGSNGGRDSGENDFEPGEVKLSRTTVPLTR